jgi:hypothetical protein
LRHQVEVVFEEAAVHVQGHGGGLVSEHPLYCLDVGSCGDGEAGGGVPQVVWGDAVESGGSCCGIEYFASPVT